MCIIAYSTTTTTAMFIEQDNVSDVHNVIHININYSRSTNARYNYTYIFIEHRGYVPFRYREIYTLDIHHICNIIQVYYKNLNDL